MRVRIKRRGLLNRRADPVHSPGKRKRGPAPVEINAPVEHELEQKQDQPWIPTSGLVGRKRRSARRG